MFWWYLLLCEDAVYNFINSIVEGSKFCTDIMKKHFKKEISTNKETNKDFENSTKFHALNNQDSHLNIQI